MPYIDFHGSMKKVSVCRTEVAKNRWNDDV